MILTVWQVFVLHLDPSGGLWCGSVEHKQCTLIDQLPHPADPGTMHTLQMSQKYLGFKYISLKEGIQMQSLTITNLADQMRAACVFRNLCFCQLVVPVPLCTSSVRWQQQPIRRRRPRHTSLSIILGGGGLGWLWVPVFAPLWGLFNDPPPSNAGNFGITLEELWHNVRTTMR